MLHTNLATRPFYNQRAVRAAIAVVAAIALGLTVYNAARVVSLSRRNAALASRVAAAEGRTRELTAGSREIRDALNRTDVNATETASREANLLIDRRAFSWTALFNRFEETLPDDVRITAVQPQVDRNGRFVLAISVVSRSVEAVDAFITAMEKSGAFHDSLTVSEQLQADNTFRSVIQSFYTGAAATPAAASESVEGAGAPAAAPAPTDRLDPGPGQRASEERR